jgi:hypothetical protein
MAHFLGDIEDTVRREGLNLSPKRMARFLDVVYSDQERAGFGLSSTGYETPATPLARVTATATPAAPSSAVQAAPRRAAAPAIEIEVDLDDLDDETVDDLDALESVEKTPPPRVGPPPTGRGRTGMGR